MEMRVRKQQMHKDVILLTDTSIFGNDKTGMKRKILENKNHDLYVWIFTYKLESKSKSEFQPKTLVDFV